VSNRISEVIVLCEDDPQARLIREYLAICGNYGRVRSEVAARKVQGGNVGWVVEHFPEELHACRQRSKRSRTLLIVMIDADQHTIGERHQQLLDRVVAENHNPLAADDPLVILIPKRHAETWIRNALGETVDEQQDYKARKNPEKEVSRRAAKAIYEWARPNVHVPEQTVPSLLTALPQWRKIC
jgi:hypothetical protein